MPQKYSDENLNNFYIQIGKNVKKAREEQKISQLELSNRLGYKSVSVISKAELCIENRHFTLDHLYRISKELNIDIFQLIKTDHFKGLNL
jgi:transcriptional regulator with XRE-family HTH domain